MKNKTMKIISLLLILTLTLTFFINTSAVKFESEEVFRIYEIKGKEEVLVENAKILDLYEENHEELETLLEEKRIEEERIEREKRINYKKQIINYAYQFVGNPYVMGGNSLTNGTDCSGFVMLIYGIFGISLPRTTTGQAISGNEVSIDDIEVGDIISYGYDGYSTHSALYAGDGMIVHAGTQNTGITVASMYIMPIISIRRVI